MHFSFIRALGQVPGSMEVFKMCDEKFINSLKIAIKKLQKTNRQLEKLLDEFEHFETRKSILFPGSAMDAVSAGCSLAFSGLAGGGSLLYAALISNGNKNFVAKPETKYRLGKIEAAISEYIVEINDVEQMYNQMQCFELDHKDTRLDAALSLGFKRNLEAENLVLKISKGELTKSEIQEARFKLHWQQKSLEKLCICF